jgi:hypothetical protein
MRLTRKLLLIAIAIFAVVRPPAAQQQTSKSNSRNQSPVISSFAPSPSTLVLPCPIDQISASGACPTARNSSLMLATHATDPNGDKLDYTYSVTGGSINGEGSHVTWEFSGVAPGAYTASVRVDDGRGRVSAASTSVTIALCPDCVPLCGLCPALSVTCPTEVDEGQPAAFTANLTQGTPVISETYKWTVSAGTITNGEGTSSITVDTTGIGGGVVTATVEVGGIDPSCNRTASCTVAVQPRIIGDPFDFGYGNIRFSDEKARLDNYAIQLQNSPTDRGVIIAYGSCQGEALNRANRAKNYLSKTRGIDASRIQIVDGGCRADLYVVLWMVPLGASAPEASSSLEVSPCPKCKAPSKRGRRTGGEK